VANRRPSPTATACRTRGLSCPFEPHILDDIEDRGVEKELEWEKSRGAACNFTQCPPTSHDERMLIDPTWTPRWTTTSVKKVKRRGTGWECTTNKYYGPKKPFSMLMDLSETRAQVDRPLMHLTLFNMLDGSNGWERLGKFYAMFSNHACMHPK
jgi:hypothetical protein